MCNYSLEVTTTKARKARQGELLRLRAIGDGVGFIGDDDEVVCLRRGTEVDFTKPVRTTCAMHDQPSVTTAKFTYLRANRTAGWTYDIFNFADGKQIMLVWLKPGQSARVLQLPASRKRAKVRKPELVSV
jgi:hypothetical protein